MDTGSSIHREANDSTKPNQQMYQTMAAQADALVSQASQSLTASGFVSDMNQGDNWGVAQSGFDKIQGGKALTKSDVVIFDPVNGRYQR